jgi:hypothetical protein
MSRNRLLYDRHGLLAEYLDDVLIYYREGDLGQENVSGPQVVRDIEPYKSMVTGEMITGRRQHRDHLRAYNCEEIGNEKMESRPVAPKGPSRQESLHRMLADVGDRDIKRIIKNTLRENR